MSERVPNYLTDPAFARDQRDAWEQDVRQVFDRVLSESPQAMVAAGLPAPSWWSSAVRKLLKRLPPMPAWARAFLDRSHPDNLETAMINLATASYNQHVLKELGRYGFTRKEWASVEDDSVRKTHEEADGTVAAIDRPFVVGGFLMQYPGDQQVAPIREWARCRCVVVGRR